MIPIRKSKIQIFFFIIFIASIFYVGGTLPCARFYYAEDEGFFGNSLLRLSYQYLYIYLLLIVHFLDKNELKLISVIMVKKNAH
jgi:hypothetical protein